MTDHSAKPLPKVTRNDRHTATPRTEAQSEVDSKQLFAGAKEIFIRHDSERYTLRHTSKGKLILTK